MSKSQETVEAWSKYLADVDDWEALVEGIEPKSGGCGLVYELPNPIDRPNESFAIADMRELPLSEAHKHINGETEIYFVIQGLGTIAVGQEVHILEPGVSIVTPPDTIHITLPKDDLVLAVVNTPPFEADNYVPVSHDDDEVADAISKLSAA